MSKLNKRQCVKHCLNKDTLKRIADDYELPVRSNAGHQALIEAVMKKRSITIDLIFEYVKKDELQAACELMDINKVGSKATLISRLLGEENEPKTPLDKPSKGSTKTTPKEGVSPVTTNEEIAASKQSYGQSAQQQASIKRQIWAIANDVRGAVDGWDFKQYVLGTLFYRFISENFSAYIEADDESVNYAELPDTVITSDIKEDAIKTKGYFIYPSQLFANVAKEANTNESLNTDLAAIFSAIEASANGYPSESDIKGLFADFDTTSNRLGNTVKNKNVRLAAVLKGVAGLDFGDFHGSQIDLFGDAYEFLISNYAANAGKSGGEFFTPHHVSRLIAQLAMHKQTKVNKIYDPAAGSGSLLLQAKKHFDAHIIEEGFFGQEINHTTYNLARMNMFLHNINYDKFNIQLGNTLIDPEFGDEKPFDAIVSNPPYSVKWIGSDDPTLINDDRFAPPGVLAPKSKADFAFVLHALSYLSSKGRAAIVCFPGIFYRGGAEQKIRKYLVDNNYVETVISLAPNLFFGTTIAVTLLVLSKHKTDTTTQFIDASGLFKKETNNNILTDEHIKQIMTVFDSKENIDHLAKSAPFEQVVEKDYNLSVSSYVEAKDTREVVDITQLNAEINTTVTKIDRLRTEIDAIVAEIEGSEAEV